MPPSHISGSWASSRDREMDNLTEQVWSLQREVQRKVRNKERVRKDPYSSSNQDSHCNTRTEN